MEPIPDLVGLPDIAKILGEPLGTVHSWRGRGEHAKIPPQDATISGVPFWLKARWSDPGKPLPALPYVVGAKEVGAMFKVAPVTVRAWSSRGLSPPDPQAIVGRGLKVWTIPPWVEWAERTQRRITLPDDYQP